MSKNVITFEVFMDIKILSKTKAKELKSLSSKKERERQGLFLAEGEKCVKDTLSAFDVELLVCSKEWLTNNTFFERVYGDKIYLADTKTIGLISSMSSLPEIIAVFKIPVSKDVIPVLSEDKLYLLLDEIQDPGNLGTIIRTCDWFGVYDIYASKNTVDVYGTKVVQSTMGSLARVRVHYVDLEELILKNKRLKLIGALLNGEPLNQLKSDTKGMLLMGNEGRGISESLKRYIDTPLTIPFVNPISHPDSLNVAIATAVILSYIRLPKY